MLEIRDKTNAPDRSKVHASRMPNISAAFTAPATCSRVTYGILHPAHASQLGGADEKTMVVLPVLRMNRGAGKADFMPVKMSDTDD